MDRVRKERREERRGPRRGEHCRGAARRGSLRSETPLHVASLLALLLVALAGVTIPVRAQDTDAVQRIARDVIPEVERAVGLTFRRPPVVVSRSRDQVRGYLSRKIAQEMPPPEMRGVERAYRAFGLISGEADLRRLMLDLYSEQVAGFYDPDSATLFVVRGADPAMVRLILAHELVHALQDQYMSLNAILKLRRQNDRQMAGQAVAEGQATLASILALTPGADLPSLEGMWDGVREGIRSQQEAMPVFAAAPRIIQEGLLFPYLYGAEFMRTFGERRARTDEQPYGNRLPVSTEQVLHPSRYTAREAPVRLSFPPLLPGDTLVYDDDFGEFETRVALETWGVAEADAIAAASGWNGDRYEVLGTPAGTAVVWATAWDTTQDAADFARTLRSGWARGPGRVASRRWRADALTVGGVSVVRLIDAPNGWAGWARVPDVRVRR
ncbi:MAG: hypothetical protein HYR48_00590 [Gemmatimonadetes bacterium]|nr:hypothetical protein [Gemmatimonadota bacterium]